jgi:hypothetical protein
VKLEIGQNNTNIMFPLILFYYLNHLLVKFDLIQKFVCTEESVSGRAIGGLEARIERRIEVA